MASENVASRRDESPAPARRASVAANVRQTAGWQKVLLIVGVLVFAIGLAGQLAGRFAGEARSSTGSNSDGAIPRGGAALVRSQGEEDAPAASAEPASGWRQHISPWMTRIGVSFLAGFVLGWVFRAFIKTVSLIGAALIAGVVLLSYFNVINIDLSKAEQQYASALAWAVDQTQRLGQTLLQHLPGSTSSALGLFVGFRRR